MQKYPWLLVLDNVNPNANVRRYYPDEGYGSVLMTAQRKSETGGIAAEVRGFSFDQACEFLKRITEQGDIPLSKEKRQAVRSLIDNLGSNPLAIDIAGTYIRQKKITYEQYLKQWEKNVFGSYRKHEDGTGYSRSLADALHMTYAQIQPTIQATSISTDAPNVAICSADAIELLKFFSFLHPESASEHILQDAYNFVCQQIRNRSRAEGPPPATWLNILTWTGPKKWDSVFGRIREALDLLSEWSLLSFDGSSKVYVHSLVQAWTRQQIDEQDRLQWYNKVSIILATNGVEKRSKKVDLASHLLNLVKIFPDETMSVCNVPWPFEDDEFKVASIWADIYGESAYYREARALRQHVCDRLDGLRNGRRRDARYLTITTHYCYSLRDLGGSCHDTGDHDTALEQYEKAMRQVEKLVGPNTSDPSATNILRTCKSLKARELQCVGDHEAAYRQWNEVWKSWSKLAGDHERLNEVLRAFREWASSSIDIGNYAQAIANLRLLISMYHAERFDPHDNDLLLARSELARAFNFDQRYQQAWEEYKTVHSLRSESFEHHPETLIAAEGQATSLSFLGKIQEAFNLRTMTLEQWKALPSQDHQKFQNFLAAKYNLARSQEELGYYESALSHHEEVLSSRLANFKDKHDKRCHLQRCSARSLARKAEPDADSAAKEHKPDVRWAAAALACPTTVDFSTSDITDSLEAMTIVHKKNGNLDSSSMYYGFTEDVCKSKLHLGILDAKSRILMRSRREALGCWNKLAFWHDAVDQRIEMRKNAIVRHSRFGSWDTSEALITTIDLGRDYWQKGDLTAAKGCTDSVLEREAHIHVYSNVFESAKVLKQDIERSARQIEQTASHSQRLGPGTISRSLPNCATGNSPYHRQRLEVRPAPLSSSQMNSLYISQRDALFEQVFQSALRHNSLGF